MLNITTSKWSYMYIHTDSSKIMLLFWIYYKIEFLNVSSSNKNWQIARLFLVVGRHYVCMKYVKYMCIKNDVFLRTRELGKVYRVGTALVSHGYSSTDRQHARRVYSSPIPKVRRKPTNNRHIARRYRKRDKNFFSGYLQVINFIRAFR